MSLTGAYGSAMGSKIITLILMKLNQSKSHLGKKNLQKKIIARQGRTSNYENSLPNITFNNKSLGEMTTFYFFQKDSLF